MRFNITDIKERIAIGAQLSSDERSFVLDCINEATAAPPVLHDPGNYMGRIEKLWVFLSVDDGGEGICGAPIPGLGPVVPLVFSDVRRLDLLRKAAQLVARQSSKVIRLAKFTAREDVEVVAPP
jgi:hypothetical protein